MTVDNHVHCGWYSDGFHDPRSVWLELVKGGITKAAISSTSTCAELYHGIVTELRQLIKYAGKDKIMPILWVTPQMLRLRWPLKVLLHSGIEWLGVKMHWQAHPEFPKNRNLADETITLSRLLGKVPALLHTGEFDCCHAGVFERLISENSDLKFVLAHGRPIDETVAMMKKYTNVWSDTAFMPKESIVRLKEERLGERVLFGTDAPINRIYYPEISTSDYIHWRQKEFEEIFPYSVGLTVY